MPEDKRLAMKWFVTVISSLLLVFSTILRSMDGLGADVTLSTVFITVSGLVWGANIADYLKKLK